MHFPKPLYSGATGKGGFGIPQIQKPIAENKVGNCDAEGMSQWATERL